jgi:hypothetical protein
MSCRYLRHPASRCSNTVGIPDLHFLDLCSTSELKFLLASRNIADTPVDDMLDLWIVPLPDVVRLRNEMTPRASLGYRTSQLTT